ncbi:MAG: serine/threonine protein kinase [Planctomycetaceae bacterium]|nr:serine/threonine protein kinase [Planctomycetaceae bacterium]
MSVDLPDSQPSDIPTPGKPGEKNIHVGDKNVFDSRKKSDSGESSQIRFFSLSEPFKEDNSSDQTILSLSPPIEVVAASTVDHIPEDLLQKSHSGGMLPNGTQLAHFVITKYIGGGGMGRVYLGMDQALDRKVAIKVLPMQRAHDQASVARFMNEAKSAARLNHEHIAQVYFAGEQGGLPFIAFEYVQGTNIRSYIEQYGVMSLPLVINYVLQIAHALSHATIHHVVHRDVKPSNILITSDGRAKLIDMGLARLLSQSNADNDLTASGVTLGTFDYISPEQARDPRNADIRSDIYSLGCTFFFMLTGRPPFYEGTVLQKLLQHQGDVPPDVREFQPGIPIQVSQIIQKMMAKDPKNRYQSPSDLIDDLAVVAKMIGLRPIDSRSLVWKLPTPKRHSFLLRQLPWFAPMFILVTIFVLMKLGLIFKSEVPVSPNVYDQRPAPFSTEENKPFDNLPANASATIDKSSLGEKMSRTTFPTSTSLASNKNDDGNGGFSTGVDKQLPQSVSQIAQTSASGGFHSGLTLKKSDHENEIAKTKIWLQSIGRNNDSRSLPITNTDIDSKINSVSKTPSDQTSETRLSSGDGIRILPVSVEIMATPVSSQIRPEKMDVSDMEINSVTWIRSQNSPTEKSSGNDSSQGFVSLTVDPSGRLPNSYQTIPDALRVAPKDAKIEVYTSETIEMPRLELAQKRLTIQAGPGYHPKLVFRPTETAVYTNKFSFASLTDSQLSMDNIDIEMVIPQSSDIVAGNWTMFELIGLNRMELQYGVLTIRNAVSDRAYHENVAFFRSASSVSGVSGLLVDNGTPQDDLSPSGENTTISLRRMIVRGEAFLLRCDNARAIDFNSYNALIVTNQPVFSLQDIKPSGSNSNMITVRFQHNTIYAPMLIFWQQGNMIGSLGHSIMLDLSDSIVRFSRQTSLAEYAGGLPRPLDISSFYKRESVRTFYQNLADEWLVRPSRMGDMLRKKPPEFSLNESLYYREHAYWQTPLPSGRPMHQLTVSDFLLDPASKDNPALKSDTINQWDAGMIPQFLPQNQFEFEPTK